MKKIYFTILTLIVATQVSFGQWTTSGTTIYNSNTGNVGIGTTSPIVKLDVVNTLSGVHSTNPSIFRISDLYNAGANGQFFQVIGAGNGTGYTNISLISNYGFLSLGARADGSATPTNSLNILSSGNVGIGTTLPTAPLDIFNVPSATPMSGGLNFSSVSAGTAFWGFRLAPTTYDFNLDVDDGVINAAALTVQRATHNIGIGTSTPYKKLDIVGAVSIGASGGSGGLGIEFGDVLGSVPSSQVRSIVTTGNSTIGVAGDIIIQPRSDVPTSTRFFIQGNEKMRIDASGNICIGTTNPQGYKLAVNGSAIATSMTVKLNANWPDYVFKKDYQLPTLQEVKTYIDQNHHLPEMPSEAEVIKDGLNLGEMNKILTKKVEELTLYLIEKDKQIKVEELKSKEQEERIKKLENQMQLLLTKAKEIN